MKLNINNFIPEDAVKLISYGFILCALVFTNIFNGELNAFIVGDSNSEATVEKLDDRLRAIEYKDKLYQASLARIEAHADIIQKMQIVQERLLAKSESLEVEMAGVRDREYARLTKE